MLKTIFLASIRPGYIRSDKNRFDTNGDGSINRRDIENLATIIKSTKFKKLDFVKAKPSKTDFLTSRVKNAFIHLQKAFIKVLVF